MKSFFIGSLLILAILCATSSAKAQAPAVKLGFVDYEVIMQQMPEFKDIDARLKGAQKVYEDSLKAMQAEFQEKADNYQKQQGLMSAEAKAQEEAKLKSLQERYLQLQQTAQGTLAQMQKQLLQPVQEKVKSAVEKVAKDDKLSAVMETAALAYYDKKLDITFKVLDYLHRGEK